MNEFDIDIDSDIGTSVLKLKSNTQNDNQNTETDIDYDKILENINNSETIKQKKLPNNKPKRNVNMEELVKNIESDLDKMDNTHIPDPLPINLNPNIIKTNKNKNKNPNINKNLNKNFKLDQNNEINIMKSLNKIYNFKHRDIILYILLFMLLNNKFVIELVYEKVPFVKLLDNPYPNLLIRSILFGMLIYLIKKFNL
jgi:hypothetical protein